MCVYVRVWNVCCWIFLRFQFFFIFCRDSSRFFFFTYILSSYYDVEGDAKLLYIYHTHTASHVIVVVVVVVVVVV